MNYKFPIITTLDESMIELVANAILSGKVQNRSDLARKAIMHYLEHLEEKV